MTARRARVVTAFALAAAAILAHGLTGCGIAAKWEANSVARQEVRLAELRAEIEALGAGLLAQITPEEIEEVVGGWSSPRKVSDFFEEWPQYYIWDATVELKQEGARRPLDVSDALAPWLAEQGWERRDGGRDEVTTGWVHRSYHRAGYTLSVQARTYPPPGAQNLVLRLGSPHSNA